MYVVLSKGEMEALYISHEASQMRYVDFPESFPDSSFQIHPLSPTPEVT